MGMFVPLHDTSSTDRGPWLSTDLQALLHLLDEHVTICCKAVYGKDSTVSAAITIRFSQFKRGLTIKITHSLNTLGA